MAAKVVWNGDAILRKAGVAIEGALKAAADEAVQDAKRLVPVDTGRLRRSIHATPVTERKGIYETDVVADAENEQGKPYGAYVELGSRGRRPQPYIVPAAEQADKALVPELRRRLRRIK